MNARYVLVAALVLAGSACSSDADPQEVLDSATDVAGNVGEAYIGDDASVEDDAAQAIGESAVVDEPTIADEPAVRVPTNEGQIEAGNWLARTYMDSSSVELVWSRVDDAETYRLYRVPTSEADYDAIDAGDVAGTELVYEGPEYGFIDTDVEANTFFTYLIVAEVGDGTTSQPRWTEALTTDDTTPPTPITNLTAEVTDDGVLLGWDPSSDDVEFASYSVSLRIGDQLEYIGGGADPGQTSFLDPEPFEGTRTYYVVAVDFHDNRSEAAQVDVVR